MIVLGVVALLCGLFAFTWLRRPARGLNLTLQRFETNITGRRMVKILISNAGPEIVYYSFASETRPTSGWPDPSSSRGLVFQGSDGFPFLAGKSVGTNFVIVPAGSPWRVVAVTWHGYSAGLWGRVQLYYDRHIRKHEKDFYTLEIPE